jgi:hypothetical protein
MLILRLVRNFALLAVLALAAHAAAGADKHPKPPKTGFCGGTCNPRYGPGWCPAGCKCYAASTRGVCLPAVH